MKNQLRNPLVWLLLGSSVALALLMCGCQPTTEIEDVHQSVWTVDGCEYLVFEKNRGTQYHILTATHKGNCGNTVHLR